MNEGLPLKGILQVQHRNAYRVLIADEAYQQTIVTTGKNSIVDAFRGATNILSGAQKIRFHHSGVGTAVAAVGNTALQTGVYTKSSGTRTEGSTANVFVSAVTIAYTGTRSITEWGIFYTSTVGASALISRKTFASKSVTNGDTLTFTWRLTVG